MARASGVPAGQARGGSAHWLMGMACGAVLAFATPTAVLAGVLLAPAILAAVFDTEKKRPMARAVLISGAGFAFGPVWHLNAMGGGMPQALEMLYDPTVLCPAWLAAACGWGACELLPFLLKLAAERAAASRIASLEAEAKAIHAEWDLDGAADPIP